MLISLFRLEESIMKKFLYILFLSFLFLIGFYIFLFFYKKKDLDNIYFLGYWLGLLISFCGLLLVIIYLSLINIRERKIFFKKNIF